jgi:parvulin-like peptidyl-prolyl isomerase
MFRKLLDPRAWLSSRAAIALAGLTVAAGGVLFFRGRLTSPALAQPPALAIAAPSTTAFQPNPTDYAARVVAFVHGTQAVTRQELGEYLITRLGPDKLTTLINRKIVDRECESRGIVITSAEVEAALEEKVKGLAVDRATFLKTVLAKHKKNLVEFKEDDLRPSLQMARLVRNRVEVSSDDLRKAFESAHGEKVEGRMILWPPGKEQAAQDAFTRLRDSEEAFSEAAAAQPTALASSGGKIKPIARYSLDENIEREAFKLRPGQVTPLIRTPQGVVLFKCDRRIPPDNTVSFEAVREKLAAEMKALKQTEEMGKVFKALREQAAPKVLLQKLDRATPGPMPSPTDAVAYLWGSQAITREELGEFLIQRFGADKLPYLINRKVIDLECKARGITVTDEEVEKDLSDYLATLRPAMDLKVFEKEMLLPLRKTLFEWREDVVRAKLLLGKLAAGRAKVTEEDLQRCFESHYGERLECRMILWPEGQHRFALAQYPLLRDSESEFDRAARNQPTPSLASAAGKLPVFGRHSLGDEQVEREAFRLQPGEVTPLIGTPQGHVMLKCDRRFPANANVTLDQVRDRLTAEVLDKKHQVEMQLCFAELYRKADPKLFLKGSDTPADPAREAEKMLRDK